MRIVLGLAAAVVAVLAWNAVMISWDVTVASDDMTSWDQAEHGVHGIKLAESMREFDVGRFARLIDERDRWPPLFPLLEAPGFLLFGIDYDTSEAMMLPYLVACIALVFGVGLAIGGRSGFLAGFGAAVLMASSPMFVVYGGMTMLEMPGTMFLLAALLFYVRWCRFEKPRDAWLTAVSTTLLFFLKYNYALLWLMALAVNEMGRSLPTPGEAVSGVRNLLRSPFWRSVPAAVLGGAFVLLVVLVALGVVGRGAAMLLFEGLVLLLVLLRAPQAVRVAREWLARQPRLATAFVLAFGLPVGSWMASPSRLKQFFIYVQGFPSPERTLTESLLFYPLEFVTDYTVPPWVGIIVLIVAVASVVWIPRLPPQRRIIPLAMGITAGLALFHPYKESRFVFTVVPLIWLSFGLVVGGAVEAVARRIDGHRGEVLVGVTALALAVCGPFVLSDAGRAQELMDEWTAVNEVSEVLEAVIDVNVTSQALVLVGDWRSLSPPLLEWHQKLYRPDVRQPARPRNDLWYGAPDPDAFVRGVLADRDVDRVVVLSLPVTAAAHGTQFERDNPTHARMLATLQSDPHFRQTSSRVFERTGYEMQVFDVIRLGDVE